MRMFLRRLAVLTAVVSIVVPVSAQAQTANPYGNRIEDVPVQVYTPPAIFVESLSPQAGYSRSGIAGTFVARNDDEETIGDLTYRLQLLGPLPPASGGDQVVADTALLYDSFTSTEVFALAPGTQKTISFSYAPPAVPAGEYRLRAQVVTMHGRDLGWDDSAITLTGEGLPFLIVAPIAILTPEYGDEALPPASGPNVNAGAAVTLQTVAENTSAQAVSAVPVVTIYSFAATRDKISTQRLETMSFRANERKLFDVPITAPQQPEAYYATLHFESANGERQSSLAEYRWVVRGVSGEIITARLTKHGAKATHEIQIDVDTVGAADAEATTTATLTATLKDDRGDVASVQSAPFPLTPALQQQTINFTLERDLVGTPSLLLSLIDADGSTLDTYTVAYPLSEAELAALADKDNGALPYAVAASANTALWVVVGLLLLAVLIALLWYLRKNKNTQPPLPSGMTTMALIIASALMVSALLAGHHQAAQAAKGNGIVIKQASVYVPEEGPVDRYVYLFVNKPRHESQYTPGEAVPIEYTVKWLGCVNQVNHAQHRVRYLPAGGKTSSYEGQWTLISDQRYTDERTCPRGVAAFDGHYCMPERNFVGSSALSGLSPQAADTTMQFQAAFGTVRGGRYFDSEEAQYAFDSKNTIIHLWLNFLRPASPTPSSAPTGTPAATPSVAPTPTPTASPAPGTSPTPPVLTACNDGIDNDGDGRIDCRAANPDPGCFTGYDIAQGTCDPNDDDESDTQCSDLKDNDGDGKTDSADPGCRTTPGNPATYNPADNNEKDPPLNPGDVQETE